MKKTLVTSIIWLVLVALTIVAACIGLYNEGIDFAGGTDIEIHFSSDISKEEYNRLADSITSSLENAGYKVGNAMGMIAVDEYYGIEFQYNNACSDTDKVRIAEVVKGVVSDAKVEVYNMKPVAENPFVMMTIGLFVAAVLIGVYALIRNYKKDKFSSAITVALSVLICVAIFNVVELILSLIGFDYNLESVTFSGVVFMIASLLSFAEVSAVRENCTASKFGYVFAVLTVVAAVLLVVFGASLTVAIELVVASIIPAVLVRPLTKMLYTLPAEGKNN